MRYDADCSPGNPWVEVAQLPYRYAGNALELAVPRELVGLDGGCIHLRFSLVRQPGRSERPDLTLHQRRQCPEPAIQLPLYLAAEVIGKRFGTWGGIDRVKDPAGHCGKWVRAPFRLPYRFPPIGGLFMAWVVSRKS